MRGLRRVESPTGRSCWGACLRCLRCLVQEVSSRGQWWCVVWCCRKEMGPWTLYHIINYNHISWIISMKHTSTHLRSPYWDGFSFQVSQPGKGKAAKHPSSPRAWSTALFATLSTLVKKFHFHFASPLFNPTRARNMERNYEFAGEIWLRWPYEFSYPNCPPPNTI